MTTPTLRQRLTGLAATVAVLGIIIGLPTLFLAIGANPIAIIIPCHRVIASNGELRGFAWGLPRKQWLLEHEKSLPMKRAAPQTELFPGL